MLEFVAALFEVVGTLSIAYAALSVHHNFLNEHKVDEKVFQTMKKEQFVAKIGVILVIAGFIIQTITHFS